MRACLVVIAALGIGAAGAAAAQQEPQPIYTQLFVSPMGEPFRAIDGPPYPVAAWFAGADANHDGVISRDEFRADALRFFKRLDLDGDGKLSDIEMHRYETQVAPEIIASTFDTSGTRAQVDSLGHDIPITRSVRQGASYYGMLDDPEPVRNADANFNMKVTLEEFLAAADRRFKLLRREGADGLKLADLPPTPFQLQLQKKH